MGPSVETHCIDQLIDICLRIHAKCISKLLPLLCITASTLARPTRNEAGAPTGAGAVPSNANLYERQEMAGSGAGSSYDQDTANAYAGTESLSLPGGGGFVPRPFPRPRIGIPVPLDNPGPGLDGPSPDLDSNPGDQNTGGPGLTPQSPAPVDSSLGGQTPSDGMSGSGASPPPTDIPQTGTSADDAELSLGEPKSTTPDLVGTLNPDSEQKASIQDLVDALNPNTAPSSMDDFVNSLNPDTGPSITQLFDHPALLDTSSDTASDNPNTLARRAPLNMLSETVKSDPTSKNAPVPPMFPTDLSPEEMAAMLSDLHNVLAGSSEVRKPAADNRTAVVKHARGPTPEHIKRDWDEVRGNQSVVVPTSLGAGWNYKTRVKRHPDADVSPEHEDISEEDLASLHRVIHILEQDDATRASVKQRVPAPLGRRDVDTQAAAPAGEKVHQRRVFIPDWLNWLKLLTFHPVADLSAPRQLSYLSVFREPTTNGTVTETLPQPQPVPTIKRRDAGVAATWRPSWQQMLQWIHFIIWPSDINDPAASTDDYTTAPPDTAPASDGTDGTDGSGYTDTSSSPDSVDPSSSPDNFKRDLSRPTWDEEKLQSSIDALKRYQAIQNLSPTDDPAHTPNSLQKRDDYSDFIKYLESIQGRLQQFQHPRIPVPIYTAAEQAAQPNPDARATSRRKIKRRSPFILFKPFQSAPLSPRPANSTSSWLPKIYAKPAVQLGTAQDEDVKTQSKRDISSWLANLQYKSHLVRPALETDPAPVQTKDKKDKKQKGRKDKQEGATALGSTELHEKRSLSRLVNFTRRKVRNGHQDIWRRDDILDSRIGRPCPRFRWVFWRPCDEVSLSDLVPVQGPELLPENLLQRPEVQVEPVVDENVVPVATGVKKRAASSWEAGKVRASISPSSINSPIKILLIASQAFQAPACKPTAFSCPRPQIGQSLAHIILRGPNNLTIGRAYFITISVTLLLRGNSGSLSLKSSGSSLKPPDSLTTTSGSVANSAISSSQRAMPPSGSRPNGGLPRWLKTAFSPGTFLSVSIISFSCHRP
ncbi:hypothetical protein Dda_5280 [Drechslerella dactyloides]|uniref:Uncharacterized protein n=1 Tax=Drechslerella dactyloides TaxID=74499 RepID=A0AAD6NIP9_DREDA|nr:hypothetical protein Dda_5280 [Drechslerella dactyloides]